MGFLLDFSFSFDIQEEKRRSGTNASVHSSHNIALHEKSNLHSCCFCAFTVNLAVALFTHTYWIQQAAAFFKSSLLKVPFKKCWSGDWWDECEKHISVFITQCSYALNNNLGYNIFLFSLRLLIGAPRARALGKQRANITGGLYKCELSLSNDCERIEFDIEGEKSIYLSTAVFRHDKQNWVRPFSGVCVLHMKNAACVHNKRKTPWTFRWDFCLERI